MNIKIIAIGKKKNDPFVTMAEEYLQKCHIHPKPKIIILPNQSSIEKESTLLLRQSQGSYRVALHERGKMLTSTSFASFLSDLSRTQKSISFLIGGASGHSKELLISADLLLSLSPMTMPHRLCLCLLSEQIYRAYEIARNGPYHK